MDSWYYQSGLHFDVAMKSPWSSDLRVVVSSGIINRSKFVKCNCLASCQISMMSTIPAVLYHMKLLGTRVTEDRTGRFRPFILTARLHMHVLRIRKIMIVYFQGSYFSNVATVYVWLACFTSCTES